MAADVLIALLITLVIAVAVSLLYFIPLDVSLILERRDAVTMLRAGATLCLVTAGVEFREGAGSFFLMFRGKNVWKRPLGEMVRTGTPSGAWDFRTAPDLFRELLQLRPGIVRIVRALVRHTRITHLACDLRFGLSSPTATGMIFGIYAALRPLVLSSERISLSATPVFDRELLEGSCRCDLRVARPLVVPALVLLLVLNPGTRALVSRAGTDRQEVAL